MLNVSKGNCEQFIKYKPEELKKKSVSIFKNPNII
jgi:hypothetical protein